MFIEFFLIILCPKSTKVNMPFFLEQLLRNLSVYGPNLAFSIESRSYTYSQLAERIASVQQAISSAEGQQYFGVVTRNSIDTYAAIIALWLLGKTSVPLGAKNPHIRNNHIVNQVGISTILDSHPDAMAFEGCQTVLTSSLVAGAYTPRYISVPPDTDLYVLFTSGSTGVPKGVRISRSNFDSYLKAFFACGYTFSQTDRCLQLFELTFDASVQCYTFPLLVGASVFTLPDSGPKFLSMYRVMNEHQVTFAKMTPSAVYYLKPYFNQISLPKLRYCLFGAEAFPSQLVGEWEHCVPNATIHNVYGPTEVTVNCTFYEWRRNQTNKTHNGIASIGKPFQGMRVAIVDENNQLQTVGSKGELCFSGPQVSKGYWQNEQIDARAFINLFVDGMERRYYRTGDLAYIDAEGDIFYLGRIDTQVQIDGHRVELGEIEHCAVKITNERCMAMTTEEGGLSRYITLVIESDDIDRENLLASMDGQLPPYMIPKEVIPFKPFPLLPSGKLDRQKLINSIRNA